MPLLICPGLWAVTLPDRGTRHFRSATLAWLYIIDPDNPALGA